MKGITEFIKHGGRFQRPNRYEVLLFPPETLRASQKDLDALRVLCHQAVFPGKQWESHSVNTYGDHHVKLPHTPVYHEVSFSFYDDSWGKARKLLKLWSSIPMDDKGALRYPSEYVGSVEIYKLNKNGERVSGVRLEEAWVEDISSQQLDAAQNDSVLDFTVVMGYDVWVEIDENGEDV